MNDLNSTSRGRMSSSSAGSTHRRHPDDDDSSELKPSAKEFSTEMPPPPPPTTSTYNNTAQQNNWTTIINDADQMYKQGNQKAKFPPSNTMTASTLEHPGGAALDPPPSQNRAAREAARTVREDFRMMQTSICSTNTIGTRESTLLQRPGAVVMPNDGPARGLDKGQLTAHQRASAIEAALRSSSRPRQSVPASPTMPPQNMYPYRPHHPRQQNQQRPSDVLAASVYLASAPPPLPTATTTTTTGEREQATPAAAGKPLPVYHRKYFVQVCILLVIICVATGVTVALVDSGTEEEALGGISSTPTPTPVPMIASEESKLRRDSFLNFIVGQGISTADQFYDPTNPQFKAFTPQFKALTWLSEVDITNTTTITTQDDPNNTNETSLVTERYVMAVFYYSLNGESWDDIDNNWLDPFLSVCEWSRAIICGEEGEDSGGRGTIQAIRQESNNIQLDGTIPSELDALPHLEELTLTRNRIVGGLAGPIHNLKKLSLGWSSLGEISKRIPTAIWEMTNLVYLDLSNNALTKLTTPTTSTENDVGIGLGALTSLTHLDLSGNFISETIPFGNLTSLTFLDLYANRLQLGGSLSTQLGLLTNLEYLDLSFNTFGTTIPSELLSCTALIHLALSSTLLSGPLPAELGLLTKLEYVDFSLNDFFGSTIPSELGRCTSLTTLDLASNFLMGSLPTELGLLTKLEAFDVSTNELTGTAPSGFRNLLLNRPVVSLEQNDFVGSLDEIFCLGSDNTTTVLSSFQGSLSADCGADPPEIRCTCCRQCCDDDDPSSCPS